MHLSKGGKGSKSVAQKAAQESSQAPYTDSEIDAEAEDEAAEESETEETVPLDLGDPDIDGEDTEGIEDVEKEALASRGDQDAAAHRCDSQGFRRT